MIWEVNMALNAGTSRRHGNLVVKCPACRQLLYTRDWKRNQSVCPHCDHHFRLSAHERIHLLLDSGSFVEVNAHLRSIDPLNFTSGAQSYAVKLKEEQERTELDEAIVVGYGELAGRPLALAVMDFRFIGGSMGSVVGEKITRAIELALQRCLPLLIVTASGGARMQEGILSLMQMAKTAAALTRLSEAHLPCISLLTDPTTGGVSASFAMLADVILAEPGALIGFAGPRVIEQFMHQKLPADAATASFLLEHGMLDAIVHRNQLRRAIAHLLEYYDAPAQGSPRKTRPLPRAAREQGQSFTPQEQTGLSRSADAGSTSPFPSSEPAGSESPERLSRWQQTQLARHQDRPYTADYIRLMCQSFFEFHGDRRYADDQAIVGGLATLAGRPVMLIGHQKGRDTRQRQRCNFGMPHPEGYRKAQRLMRQAEKFGLPVICLIDTPGASPDLEAEQRGQAQAIAESLEVMATLRVPTIAVVIGEGGSGGALALGLTDRVLMLEHAVYTVAAPEAAASILWRDNAFAPEAAEALRVTAADLLELGVIDEIVREPAEGAHRHHELMAQSLAETLRFVLDELEGLPLPELLDQRYAKFRGMGCFMTIDSSEECQGTQSAVLGHSFSRK